MEKLYSEYLAIRQGPRLAYYIPTATSAWQQIKHKRTLKAWQERVGESNFSTNSDNLAHTHETEKGYKIVFKIEPDYDAPYDDMKHQGYDYALVRGHNKPEFAEHGEFTRHSGEGLRAYLDLSNDREYIPAVFDIPEAYMRQFYDTRNQGKHAAYINMVASTRQAIEQDIKNYCKTEYYTISVHLYAPSGEELESDYTGGCDYAYCRSGDAFKDHHMFEVMLEKEVEHFALIEPQAIPENFTAAYAI